MDTSILNSPYGGKLVDLIVPVELLGFSIE